MKIDRFLEIVFSNSSIEFKETLFNFLKDYFMHVSLIVGIGSFSFVIIISLIQDIFIELRFS